MINCIIADDEHISVEGISFLINKYFPEINIVDRCYDGVEVLLSIEKYKPQILFLDINMPFLNGMDTITKIRKRNNNLAIIVISGYDKFEYIKHAMDNQVSAYLLKPLSESEFKTNLQKVIFDINHKETYESIDLISYIKQNLTSADLNATSICNYFNISNSTLTRKLKKEVDLTLVDYINQLKVEKAKILIQTTNLSIKDISEEIGYLNQTYFNRIFKLITTMTPLEYKKKLKEDVGS